jgi:hypothetical protein
VLEGLARALQLDDAERAHLFDLAWAAGRVETDPPKRSRPGKQRIRPAVQRILGQISAPATVRNARLDHIGANALGRALYAPLPDSREQPANSARFTFLDPAAAGFHPERERVAADLVAHLRSEAGRNAYDRQLSDLIGELSTRNDEFRVRWAAHDVRFHRTGAKRIHHPVVGSWTLSTSRWRSAPMTGRASPSSPPCPASTSRIRRPTARNPDNVRHERNATSGRNNRPGLEAEQRRRDARTRPRRLPDAT